MPVTSLYFHAIAERFVIPAQSLPPRRRGAGIHSGVGCFTWIPVFTGIVHVAGAPPQTMKMRGYFQSNDSY